MNEEETTNYKSNKQQKVILEDLLIYSKALKNSDFHSKIIISADGVYLEQTKEFHPLDETLQEIELEDKIIELADYFISENKTYREAKIACEKLLKQVSREIELRAMERSTKV